MPSHRKMLQKAPHMDTLIKVASHKAGFAEKVEKGKFFVTKSSITLKQEYREATVPLCRKKSVSERQRGREFHKCSERLCVSDQFWKLL